MVSVADIWKELRKPPFGLLPNTGSVFLLGFLLGEYADSTYYKRDTNNNTVSLNYVDLSELIFGVIKNLPKAQGQFIVRQTSEQMKFCQITGEIFKIAKEKRNSVDDIAKNINIYLTNNKYPMWAIRYFIEEELYDHAVSYTHLRAHETDSYHHSSANSLSLNQRLTANDQRLLKKFIGCISSTTPLMRCLEIFLALRI